VAARDLHQPSARAVGRVLILFGVAVWVPYAALLIMGQEPDIRIFLPVHLAGVLPGAVLTRYAWLRGKLHALRHR